MITIEKNTDKWRTCACCEAHAVWLVVIKHNTLAQASQTTVSLCVDHAEMLRFRMYLAQAELAEHGAAHDR